jgi:nucleotide-binding universal stress UspA family protein
MIRTIVTPIDGSMHAQMAVDLSTDLAARYDAQMILLHVADGDGNVPEELYGAASRELEEAESSGRETGVHPHQSRHLRVLEYMGHTLLRNAKEQAEGKGVRHVETVIDFGDAGLRILHYAKQRSADLIVMGSRGFGKLKGLVLGSVSHKVFHLAPCSCVTMRRRDPQSALEGIKNILVPTDGSDQAGKAVDLASDIAGKYGAKLALVYVMWRGPSLENLRASIDLDQLSESARGRARGNRRTGSRTRATNRRGKGRSGAKPGAAGRRRPGARDCQDRQARAGGLDRHGQPRPRGG